MLGLLANADRQGGDESGAACEMAAGEPQGEQGRRVHCSRGSSQRRIA
jgi:hypothetical protein